MTPPDNYQPLDELFDTHSAMYFVKKGNRQKFNDFLREFKVGFIQRPNGNYFLRSDLMAALEAEKRINYTTK